MAPAQYNADYPANHSPSHVAQASMSVTAPGGKILVLIDFPLTVELINRIASVDPRVAVVPSFIPTGNLPSPDARGEDGWKKLEDAQLDAALLEANVLFSFWPPAAWLQKAPKLKWVQLASAGADHLLREGTLHRYPNMLVTTASGIHEVPISEHIVGMILHFSRGFDKAVRNQQQRKWERFTLGEALGKTVCFVGYGPIARRAAVLCRTLGMRTIAVRASITQQEPGTNLDPMERFYPVSDLNPALAQSDYVVVAAPRTPLSENMIGRQQFAAMKPNAVLINISRGALIDEAALAEALQTHRLAGAGLDVFAQEPLPENSPLWAMPNVLITPHVSGSNPHYHDRATAFFCENLARYLRGELLRNIVNLERGY